MIFLIIFIRAWSSYSQEIGATNNFKVRLWASKQKGLNKIIVFLKTH